MRDLLAHDGRTVTFFRRILVWLFAPTLVRLEREASEIGRLILQQTDLAEGLGWSCALRAHQDEIRGPRYSWTSTGATIEKAIEGCLEQARGGSVKKIVGLPHAPRLGGREYDE